jgi:prepilin-type N-terminal cleavage/methylation domain-containing protein
MSRRQARRRGGYTLIEVMMAIAIITASAVALFGLQTIVVRGNMDARQMTTATTIVRNTLELMRLDAVTWTQSYPSAGSVAWGTSGRGFLRDAPTAAAAAAPAWAPFGATIVAPEHAYDYQGRIAATAADMFFCVESRYAWVYPGQALRADVRVWWVRPNSAVSAATFAGCPTQGLVLNLANLHSLQGSTVLRYTPTGVP